MHIKVVNLKIMIAFVIIFATCNASPLMLYWDFNEELGSEIVYDISGNGYNGVVNSGTWIRKGKSSALEWIKEDKQGVSLSFNRDSPLYILDQITIEICCRLNEYPGVQHPGAKNTTCLISGPGYSLYIDEVGTARLMIRTGLESAGDYPYINLYGGTVPLKQWVRLGFTYNSITGDMVLFINRAPIAKRRLVGLHSYLLNPVEGETQEIIVRPKSRWADWRLLDGAISDVRIWKGVKELNWPAEEDDAGVPSELVAKRERDGSVLLSWVQPAPDCGIYAHSYNVYCINNKGLPQKIASSVKGLSYKDSMAGKLSTQYMVTSLDYWGRESGYSETIIATGIGDFKGEVFCLETGFPIEGALVSLLGTELVARTKKDGSFSFYNIEDNSYEVLVTKVGFRQQSYSIFIEEGYIREEQFNLIQDIEPPIPPDLLAVSELVGALKVEWVENGSEPIQFYKIYRSPDNTLPQKDWLLVGYEYEKLYYIDANIDSSQTFYYGVVSVDLAQNESMLSNICGGRAIETPVPNPISPKSNQMVVDSPILFEWSYEIAEQVSFELQISEDKRFVNCINVAGIKGNSFEYFRDVMSGGNSYKIGLPDGEWYWRIRAIFSYGAKSEYSEVWKVNAGNTKCWSSETTPGGQIISGPNEMLTIKHIPTFALSPNVLRKGGNEVKVSFVLSRSCMVDIKVYDLRGRLVSKVLSNLLLGENTYDYTFRADKLSPGFYIFVISALANGKEEKNIQRLLVLD